MPEIMSALFRATVNIIKSLRVLFEPPPKKPQKKLMSLQRNEDNIQNQAFLKCLMYCSGIRVISYWHHNYFVNKIKSKQFTYIRNAFLLLKHTRALKAGKPVLSHLQHLKCKMEVKEEILGEIMRQVFFFLGTEDFVFMRSARF